MEEKRGTKDECGAARTPRNLVDILFCNKDDG